MGLPIKIRLCFVAEIPSSEVNSSSYNFSPGLIPVYSILISFPGSKQISTS